MMTPEIQAAVERLRAAVDEALSMDLATATARVQALEGALGTGATLLRQWYAGIGDHRATTSHLIATRALLQAEAPRKENK
jgi:hypothetical protein